MKLRNKKTGEIGEYIAGTGLAYIVRVYAVRSGDTPFVDYQYNSLAKFYKEWEDAPEEPKEYWTISGAGYLWTTGHMAPQTIDDLKEIGNYFETKEEAEEAIEKLKAWRRLKDKILGHSVSYHYNGTAHKVLMELGVTINQYENMHKDLTFLFGGEE